MATVYQTLLPEEAQFQSAAYAQLTRANGTNFPVSALAFEGLAADEEAFWKFRAYDYGSGNVTVDIDWYADTASSGDVRFGAAIAAITPNTDSQDVETDGLGTAIEGNDSHLGTTGQRVHRASLTITSLDSLAADDLVFLRLYREASDTGNDTMTGDANVVLVTVSYSDT